jgi:hypothetical protein
MSDPLRHCNSQSATRHLLGLYQSDGSLLEASTSTYSTIVHSNGESRDQLPPKKLLQHSRTHSLVYANQWWLLQLLFQ